MFPSSLALDDIEISLPLARFLVQLQAAGQITVHKDVMGAACMPCRALAMGPAPPHAAAIERWLPCPVAFEQPANELHYDSAWLDRPPQLANPFTANELLQTCTTLLAEYQRATGIAGKVYKALIECSGHFPDVEAIAARLHMTSRTLRRKLDAEGTSYQGLLVDVRRSLAIDYRRGTSMTVEDIAEALAFSDAASFRHAFRRWTLKRPSEFRLSA